VAVMEKKREQEFLRMLGSRGTRNILVYLKVHGEAQHNQFDEFLNTCTLNIRLGQLLKFGLVEHHLVKKNARKEWYSLTERGEKILKHLEEMAELVESPSE
jgi:DNA-binding HxlR family transcriptional regulator